MKQRVKKLCAGPLLFTFVPLTFRNPLQMWQPPFVVDFTRLLVMQESKVKTEGGNPHGFLIDVHSHNLLAQDFAKLWPADTFAVLFRPKITHHPAERFDEKNSRTTSWVAYPGPWGRKNLPPWWGRRAS